MLSQATRMKKRPPGRQTVSRGNRHANRHCYRGAAWFFYRQQSSTGSTNVRTVSRSTTGLHEELRWKDLQDRIRHLHERLQKITTSKSVDTKLESSSATKSFSILGDARRPIPSHARWGHAAATKHEIVVPWAALPFFPAIGKTLEILGTWLCLPRSAQTRTCWAERRSPRE